MKLVLLTLLVGCAAQPTDGPIVKLVYTQAGVPSDVAAFTEAGASAWFGQGIAFDANATGTECSLDWYDPGQTLPCVLTVRITYAAASSISNDAGITAHRDTTLAYELSGDALTAVAAHEVGHSVWNTSDHLAPGLDGIMASAAHGTTPTAADVAFASAKTNGWVQP
jgi:hypothetical protein